MDKIAEKRRRLGHRRIGVMLARVGMVITEKKLSRIHREDGLSVRRRRGRKRPRGSRTPMPAPLRPNQRWSLDFLSDTLEACRETLGPVADPRDAPSRLPQSASWFTNPRTSR